MRICWLIIVLLACPRCTFGQTTSTSQPADVRQSIAQLADPRFAVRERASEYLLRCGPSIQPLLIDASHSPDPEVSQRANQILQEFSLGVLPETPPAVIELLAHYMRGDVTEKEITLNQLSRQAGFGNLIVLRLSQEETDPAVKSKAEDLAHEGISEIQRTAGELLASHPDAAERLLECATAAGDEISARTLAAMLLQTQGAAGIQQTITRLQKPADSSSAENLKYPLVLLQRAAGDLPHAIADAEAAHPQLAWQLLVEDGQWAQVALHLWRMNDFLSPPQRLGIIATASRFHGNFSEYRTVISHLRDLGSAAQSSLFLTLALNDEPKEAADVLIETHDDLNAFSLLTLCAQYNSAIELSKRSDIPADQQQSMRVRSALLQIELGHAVEAVALCHELEKKIGGEKAGPAALFDLCTLEHRLSAIDVAWEAKFHEHALAALAGAPPENVPPRLFSQLLPHTNGEIAALWWRVLSAPSPSLPIPQRLQQLHDLMYGRLKDLQLQQMGEKITKSPLDPEMQAKLLQWLVDEFTRQRRSNLAANHLDRELKLFEHAEQWTAAGRIAAANESWTRAANDLAKSSAIPDVWMRGWVLTRMQKDAEGKALMDQAMQGVLANDKLRNELGWQMQSVGQDKSAQQQYLQLMHIGEPGSWSYCVACQRLGDLEFGRKQWAQAVAHWQRYSLMQFVFSAVFDDFEENVEFPRAMHEAQARAALDNHDEGEALLQLKQMLDLNPIKIDPVIALSNWLRSWKPQLSRQIFDQAVSNLTALIQKYPDDAMLHNCLAWLCAQCNYEPQLAMQHALRAVALEPRDVDSLDTLAEIYSHAGNKTEAIKCLQQCRQIDPDNSLWDEREKKYK